MFWRVINLNQLFTIILIFNLEIEIQNGCQSWPLISASRNIHVTLSIILKQLALPWTWQNKQLLTLGCFLTNDNVNNEDYFHTWSLKAVFKMSTFRSPKLKYCLVWNHNHFWGKYPWTYPVLRSLLKSNHMLTNLSLLALNTCIFRKTYATKIRTLIIEIPIFGLITIFHN